MFFFLLWKWLHLSISRVNTQYHVRGSIFPFKCAGSDIFGITFDKPENYCDMKSDEFRKLLQIKIKIFFWKMQNWKIKSISKKMCRASLYKLNIYFAERPYHTIWVYTNSLCQYIPTFSISRYICADGERTLSYGTKKKMCCYLGWDDCVNRCENIIQIPLCHPQRVEIFLFIYSITTDNFISVLIITSVHKVICLLGIIVNGVDLCLFALCWDLFI